MKGILTRVSNFLTRIKSISRMTDDSIRPDLRTGSVSGGGSPVLEKDERSSPVSATEAAQALFERLERSVMNHDPEIRRLKSEDLRDQNVLVNQLISLMFRVRETNTTLISANWLNDALDDVSEVDLHLSVFYIYLDENTPIGQWDEIKRAIFRQLNDYVKLHESVRKFIDKRFKFLWQRLHPGSSEAFDPDNSDHTTKLQYIVPCHVTVYHKKFPLAGRHDVFIVGRRPLHDLNEIDRSERQRESDNELRTSIDQTTDDPIVRLAATVKAAGNYKGSYVVFNAHRFSPGDAGTRNERRLYLGNWRSDWELSIGSAEHDEIRCKALGSNSAKAYLHNLKLGMGRWDCEYSFPEGLPGWFNCGEEAMFDDVSTDKVKVCVARHPTIRTPLRSYLERKEVIPKITLWGRALHNVGGQVNDLADTSDQSLKELVDNLSIVSAVEVRQESLWLVRTSDEKVYRVFKDVGWESKQLADGDRFTLGGFMYSWNKAVTGLLPDEYYGQLKITAPDQQRNDLEQDLASDPGAENLPIGTYNVFTDKMHRDSTLGEEGPVSLKCVELQENRPIYTLLPVPGARNDHFAFWTALRPQHHPTGWLVYNDKLAGDLRPGTRGLLAYEGEDLLIDGANNKLVCGTSIFQIKTRGTPDIGDGSNPRGTARPSEGGGGAPPLSLVAMTPSSLERFDPTNLADVSFRLSGTRWSAYDIREISRSNIAIHYGLSYGDEKFFLKVYYLSKTSSAEISGRSNAEREADFYRRYEDRADSLFLCAPEVILAESDDEPPWAILFPRLTPFEEVIPVPTLGEACAVGLGAATLISAMAEDHLMNYDLDPSMLCVNNRGGLVVVDFDNTFPMLGDQVGDINALRGILQDGRLPSKSSLLPPEARAFHSKSNIAERQEELAKIGTPFCVYMMAALLLEFLNLATDAGEGNVTFEKDALQMRAVQSGESPEAARRVDNLLREMLSLEMTERPSIDQLVSRFESITNEFARASPKAEARIIKLLGRQAD